MWQFTKCDNAFSYLPTLATDLDGDEFCLIIAYDKGEPEPFQLMLLGSKADGSDDFEYWNFKTIDALRDSLVFRVHNRPLTREQIANLTGVDK